VVQYPKEYIDYLVFFHADRDYFECHEVLEEYWKSGEMAEFNQAWIGLIQIAVGMYHHRRGNLGGAGKMISSAVLILNAEDLASLGINADKLSELLKARMVQLTQKQQDPFTDMNIPIEDPALLQLCMNECTKRELSWEQPSDLMKDAIVHKHALRDRSEVIQTRLQQKKLKQLHREEGRRKPN
jgi:predicted metal-dependent hydrolase